MSEDNLRYILDECIKLHEQKIVRCFSFEISGGEPFLAFDTFSKVIPEYYDKYKHIFKFSSASNGTIINDEIISFFKNYYRGACISLDSLQYSKPLNGISSSPLQIENIAKLNNEGVKVSSISVFNSQSVNEMLELAEYAVKNLVHWRILLAKPLSIMKDKILEMAKPVLKYLYENDYAPDSFDFDGWNLWTKKNVAGCPCGRTLFGIMPDLEVIPNNGEEIIKLGKFSADGFLDIVNNPLNDYYRKDVRPNICNDCELRSECDGGCRANHKNPEMLKERCDAIKELFEYVQTLKK